MPVEKVLPFDSLIEGENETSRTYYIDWEAGRISGFVNGESAMHQYIKKALLTSRFKCLIYDSQYGSEIKETLIDPAVTREYILAEVPFLVEDALIHDDRVLKVYNIKIQFDDTYPMRDSVLVTFDVDTIFGKIPVKEGI